ncbi:MAG: hypothetical protein IPI01_20745 [Ignavibacteriae bacterium]|nr:hypothetical protein [Ignavibacteriota bacterium]
MGSRKGYRRAVSDADDVGEGEMAKHSVVNNPAEYAKFAAPVKIQC